MFVPIWVIWVLGIYLGVGVLIALCTAYAEMKGVVRYQERKLIVDLNKFGWKGAFAFLGIIPSWPIVIVIEYFD